MIVKSNVCGKVLACSSSAFNVAVSVCGVCEDNTINDAPLSNASENGADTDNARSPRPPLVVTVAMVAAPVATIGA